MKTLEVFGPSIFRPAHSGLPASCSEKCSPCRSSALVSALTAWTVVAVRVGRLELDHGVLPDDGRQPPSSWPLAGLGSSSATVISNDNSGDAAVFDRPISPPSLSWK